MKDDDQIIRQRIDGRSVRAIASARRTTVSAINEAIDRWASSAIDDKVHNTLALELARLDELQEAFYARALDGYVQCAGLNRATLCNAWPIHAADGGVAERR